MAMVMMPATRAVPAAMVASVHRGSACPVASNPPVRMEPFTNRMYAITMKVVSPARSSVPTVVPRSLSLKKASSPPRAGGAAAQPTPMRARARHDFARPPSPSAPEEEVHDHGEDDADDDHRHDREEEAPALALDGDVARQPAERQSHAGHRQSAEHHQHDPDDEDHAAELREIG